MKSTIFKSTVLALTISSPMAVMANEPLSQTASTVSPVNTIVQIPVFGARVASGALALPLMFVGEIGNISGQAGERLWEHANQLNKESIQSNNNTTPVNSNEEFL